MAETKELAIGYANLNDTQHNTGSFLLQRLGVAPGNGVLDVGCGPGNLTARISELVGDNGSVVGIDPSEERIAMAQEIATAKLSFHVGRAEDLSRFPASSFDIVFVNSTFHWVQDQLAALKEIHRVLKPGGRVGLSGGSGDYLTHQERIKADVLGREPYRNYPEQAAPKFLKQQEMESLLDTSGFHTRDFVINNIVKATKDADEMIDWLVTSSSGKTFGGIPLDMRPKAREEMKVEFNKLLTKDGIRMDMELLVTVATKN